MSDLDQAIQDLGNKDDEDLYDILRSAEDYRPEMVDAVRAELLRRGLSDSVPRIPEVEWSEVKRPSDLPERHIRDADRNRIRRQVKARHKEGEGYRELLLTFPESDWPVAATFLSRLPDNERFASQSRRHGILAGAWVLLSVVLVLAEDYFTAVFCLLVWINLLTKSRWGYLISVLIPGLNLAVFLSGLWGVSPGALSRGVGSLDVSEVVLLVVEVLIFAFVAVLAVNLHRGVFPYMRIFEVRRDQTGRPAILELVEANEP